MARQFPISSSNFDSKLKGKFGFGGRQAPLPVSQARRPGGARSQFAGFIVGIPNRFTKICIEAWNLGGGDKRRKEKEEIRKKTRGRTRKN